MTIRLSNRLNALEADLGRPGEDTALRERIERARARMASFQSPAEQVAHEARHAGMSARVRRVREEGRRMGIRPSIAMLLHAARMEG